MLTRQFGIGYCLAVANLAVSHWLSMIPSLVMIFVFSMIATKIAHACVVKDIVKFLARLKMIAVPVEMVVRGPTISKE
jgi:hypothetical protein